MIAGAILMGRALAPVDLLIVTWKGFLSARSAHRRLRELLAAVPQRPVHMCLPVPKGQLQVEEVVAVPPGAGAPALGG